MYMRHFYQLYYDLYELKTLKLNEIGGKSMLSWEYKKHSI